MSKDKRRRMELKAFISANMKNNSMYSRLLEKMDDLPSEYIEELYAKLEAIGPVKALGKQGMAEDAIKQLEKMIESSLRYHE